MFKYKVEYYDHGAYFVDEGLVDGSRALAEQYLKNCFNCRPEILLGEMKLEEVDHVLIKNRIQELFR